MDDLTINCNTNLATDYVVISDTNDEHNNDNNGVNNDLKDRNDLFIKCHQKISIDSTDDVSDKKDIDHEWQEIGNKSLTMKVSPSEDMSNQFFASGPFYAIDDHNGNSRRHLMDTREMSDNCNVLYAEMPHNCNEDLTVKNLGHNHTSADLTTCCTNGSIRSQRSSKHLVVDSNYQFVCLNCCSPISISEEVSQLNDDLYYISSDNSRPQHNHRNEDLSSEEINDISSPIMLKFCKESIESMNNNISDESKSSNCIEKLSNYTTVIKPKAVRPQLTPIGQQISGHHSDSNINGSQSGRSLPTFSFHGSTTVLSDNKDESAFTQIPRRRSNSEATHHYQSINNDIPSRNRYDYNRPLRHQRSKSVNKSYNSSDQSLAFSKCQAISDKHLTQIQSNNTNMFSKNFNTLDEQQRSSSQKHLSEEPIHMTLEEVRNIFFNRNQSKQIKSSSFGVKNKLNINREEEKNNFMKSKSKSKIKSAIESLFRGKRKSSLHLTSCQPNDCQLIGKKYTKDSEEYISNNLSKDSSSPFTHRALPPLPNNNESSEKILENKSKCFNREDEERQKFLDYAASIERVKDCGWYWGPISGEMAEKLLESEPCGSFIVRDSSDEHYIFSLTFKLDGLVRHVRIEHDQGNFSFGTLQKFRSNTIVDFIENAVQHSRSGRFLFFLHRRPVMGPMRVQLLHPVSRFKQIQSLQHMCRFIILKHVRRDLIECLPLPKMLKTYLNTPYYYSEELALMDENNSNAKSALEPSLSPNASHENE
ncbi:GATA zinc finger domain-containing protein 14-like [Oppia nitens]|uniref:GATA zinc finger domain-containing protein 14-like n=1 Tax=Oppia nitens TaxID=1686743 RepID=UPI0023DBE92A|nr:GATA zinc finger domain-containing protein 14-like [Oppia nitens]